MADEDATVEVEDEGFDDEVPFARPIINSNPNFVMATYNTVTSFLVSYGWTMVMAGIVLIVMWSNLEPKLRKLLEKRRSMDAIETDPEIIAKRAEAIEQARQRMQEKASAILKKEAERRKELEEIKKQERLEDYDALRSGKSSHSTQRRVEQHDKLQNQPAKNKTRPQAKPLRSDYNPLAGPSSGSRYRPAPSRSSGG